MTLRQGGRVFVSVSQSLDVGCPSHSGELPPERLLSLSVTPGDTLS